MIMSLADSGLFAAFTAALSGEGDSCCGYQQTLQDRKTDHHFGDGKGDDEIDCQHHGQDDQTGELMPAGAWWGAV